MSAAIVIVFLLNGIQVALPAPAVLLEKATYVPARAVFEELGCRLDWYASQGAVQVWTPNGRLYVLDLHKTTVLGPGALPRTVSSVELGAAPRLVRDLLYVPVRALALVAGGRAEWDKANMTVNLITYPAGDAVAADIGALIADPPHGAGQRVRLRGEYTGWQADPYGPATTHGPPVTRNDWTVRDATGSLFCTRAAEAPELAGKLDPINDLGRRLEVVGTVALTAGGWPYLQVGEVVPLGGVAGITCYLTTDRDKYQPGDTMKMQIQVRNPTREAMMLNFSTSQQYDFTVSDAEGKVVWKWSQDRMFAQMLTQKMLQPGDAYTVTAQWALPGTLPPAQYKVSGLINRDVQSYVKTIAVGE